MDACLDDGTSGERSRGDQELACVEIRSRDEGVERASFSLILYISSQRSKMTTKMGMKRCFQNGA